MKLFTVFIWSTFLYCLKKTGLVQNHIFVVCDLYEMSNISLALRRRKRSATTRRQMGRTLMQNLDFCPKTQFWWNLLQHWIWIFPPKIGLLRTWFCTQKMKFYHSVGVGHEEKKGPLKLCLTVVENDSKKSHLTSEL